MSDVMVLLIIGVLIGYVIGTINALPFVLGMFASVFLCHIHPPIHEFLNSLMNNGTAWCQNTYHKVRNNPNVDE
jgi:hypothetical protein